MLGKIAIFDLPVTQNQQIFSVKIDTKQHRNNGTGTK